MRKRTSRTNAVTESPLIVARDLAINEEIAGRYRRDFGKQLGCGLADCMIAATATFHGLDLVTQNAKHFGMLSGVIVPYIKS